LLSQAPACFFCLQRVRVLASRCRGREGAFTSAGAADLDSPRPGRHTRCARAHHIHLPPPQAEHLVGAKHLHVPLVCRLRTGRCPHHTSASVKSWDGWNDLDQISVTHGRGGCARLARVGPRLVERRCRAARGGHGGSRSKAGRSDATAQQASRGPPAQLNHQKLSSADSPTETEAFCIV